MLRVFSAIIKSAATELGDSDDTVSYMGQDDFVIITAKERSELLSIRIIENFEAIIGQFYDEDVIKRGYIWTKNDQGEEVQNPLLSIGIGIINAEPGGFKHYSQIMDKAKQSLKEAKKSQKSSYVKA